MYENERVMEENEELQSNHLELTRAMTEDNSQLRTKITTLESQIAKITKRSALYESEHTSSSMGSMFQSERVKFKKENGDYKPGIVGSRKGHAGISHNNKSTDTIIRPVDRCCVCNSKDIVYLYHKSKSVHDINENKNAEYVTYNIQKVWCHKCDIVSTGEEPTLKETSLGKNVLGCIMFLHALRLTDRDIAQLLEEFFGFKIVASTVWNARNVIANAFESQYAEIMNELSQSPYVQMDESRYNVNGKKGYVWLATNKKATYVVVTSSIKVLILDQYFSSLLEIPVVVDGYQAYNKFKII